MKRDKDVLDVIGRSEAMRAKRQNLYILLGILAFLILTALIRYGANLYINEMTESEGEISVDKGEATE